MTTQEKLIEIAQNTADAIEENREISAVIGGDRANTLQENKEKLNKLNAELEQTLYGTDSGGKSYYDELWDGLAEGGKILPTTASGNPIIVDDVSEVLHDLKVQLTSDTITDFSGIEVTQKGKNIYGYIKPNVSNGTIIEKLENGAIVQGNQADETVAQSLSNRGSFNSGITSASAICPKVFGGQTIVLSADVTLLEIGNSPIPNQIVPYIYIQGGQSSYYGGETILTLNVKQRVKAIFTIKEQHSGKIIYPVFRLNSNTLRIENIQLEYGDTATNYSSYKENKAIANKDGTVEGLKSIPLKMSLLANSDANIELNYNKSYGVDYEWNAFWDMIQAKGTRPNYRNAFRYWNFEYCHPKYKVVVTEGATYEMFRNCTRLKKIEKEYIDVSKGLLKPTNTSMDCHYYTFALCPKLVEIEDIGLNESAYCYTFTGSEQLKKIEKIRVEITTKYISPFSKCYALEELGVEGEIGENGFNLSACSKLNKASIINVVNCLSTSVSGKAVTFSKTAINNAFGIDVDDVTTYPEGSEYYELRNSKSNWDIAYA